MKPPRKGYYTRELIAMLYKLRCISNLTFHKGLQDTWIMGWDDEEILEGMKPWPG